MELNELQQKVVHDNDHLSVSEAEADVDAYRRVSIATEISPLTELVASATKSQLAPDDVLNEQPVVEARASIATIHDPIPSTSTSTTNSFTISTITRTLDIKFEDLSYSVKTGLLRRGKSQNILIIKPHSNGDLSSTTTTTTLRWHVIWTRFSFVCHYQHRLHYGIDIILFFVPNSCFVVINFCFIN